MNVMGAWRIFFGRGIVGYAVLDIQRQALVHRHGVEVGGDGVGEKPLTPAAGVADAAGDVRVPALERAARGIGQDECSVKTMLAQSRDAQKDWAGVLIPVVVVVGFVILLLNLV